MQRRMQVNRHDDPPLVPNRPGSTGLYVLCYHTCWLSAGIAAAFKLDRLPGVMCCVHTDDDTIYGTAYSSQTGSRCQSLATAWNGAMWWLCRNPGYGFAGYVLGFVDVGVERQETLYQILGPARTR